MADADEDIVYKMFSAGHAPGAIPELDGWDKKRYSKALKKLVAGEQDDALIDAKFPRFLYFLGIGVWVLIWIILWYFEVGQSANLGLFGSRGHFLIFVVPPWAIALTTLLTNAFLWGSEARYSEPEIELKIIDIVERNASFFLVGSSAVFFFASFSFRDLGLRFSFSAFIIYETLSLICLSFVLLLYWIPHEDKPRNLARLRHFKTIPFTFAVSFFLAALMIITTAALPILP